MFGIGSYLWSFYCNLDLYSNACSYIFVAVSHYIPKVIHVAAAGVDVGGGEGVGEFGWTL